MTDQHTPARAPSVHIPPEGRWGIDVRYFADGRQEKHWVPPGTDPDVPGVRYQTHPAACTAPTWLVAHVRSALWDHWDRCEDCQTAEREHRAALADEGRTGMAKCKGCNGTGRAGGVTCPTCGGSGEQ